MPDQFVVLAINGKKKDVFRIMAERVVALILVNQPHVMGRITKSIFYQLKGVKKWMTPSMSQISAIYFG